MQIYIKTLTGRKIQLNFEGDNKIVNIKQSLQEKEGIMVDQMRLIYNGRQLEDPKAINEYHIPSGGTIHMILALRGG